MIKDLNDAIMQAETHQRALDTFWGRALADNPYIPPMLRRNDITERARKNSIDSVNNFFRSLAGRDDLLTYEGAIAYWQFSDYLQMSRFAKRKIADQVDLQEAKTLLNKFLAYSISSQSQSP